MANFSFADAVEISGVARVRLQRLADSGIIQAAGGGSQGKPRRWSMRNLVEARVCDICRELGLGEQMLRRVVLNLNAIWDQPDAILDAERPDRTFADATVLWIEFSEIEWPDELRASESDLQQFIASVADETKASPTTIRALIDSKIEAHSPEHAALVRGERATAPMVAMFPLDNHGLIARLTGAHADSGIVIQLARIIREIEEASGETFDFATALKRALAKALAKKESHDHE